MATMIAATAARAAHLSKARAAFTASRGFTSTSVVSGNLPVDFDHFSSGWSEEVVTKGKFHIETFNKISPLVSYFPGAKQ